MILALLIYTSILPGPIFTTPAHAQVQALELLETPEAKQFVLSSLNGRNFMRGILEAAGLGKSRFNYEAMLAELRKPKYDAIAGELQADFREADMRMRSELGRAASIKSDRALIEDYAKPTFERLNERLRLMKSEPVCVLPANPGDALVRETQLTPEELTAKMEVNHYDVPASEAEAASPATEQNSSRLRKTWEQFQRSWAEMKECLKWQPHKSRKGWLYVLGQLPISWAWTSAGVWYAACPGENYFNNEELRKDLYHQLIQSTIWSTISAALIAHGGTAEVSFERIKILFRSPAEMLAAIKAGAQVFIDDPAGTGKQIAVTASMIANTRMGRSYLTSFARGFTDAIFYRLHIIEHHHEINQEEISRRIARANFYWSIVNPVTSVYIYDLYAGLRCTNEGQILKGAGIYTGRTIWQGVNTGIYYVWRNANVRGLPFFDKGEQKMPCRAHKKQ